MLGGGNEGKGSEEEKMMRARRWQVAGKRSIRKRGWGWREAWNYSCMCTRVSAFSSAYERHAFPCKCSHTHVLAHNPNTFIKVRWLNMTIYGMNTPVDCKITTKCSCNFCRCLYPLSSERFLLCLILSQCFIVIDLTLFIFCLLSKIAIKVDNNTRNNKKESVQIKMKKKST